MENDPLTTGQTASIFGAKEWQIRRLYESGNLPEPEKFGGKRVIRRSSLPAISDALRLHGWLPVEEVAAK